MARIKVLGGTGFAGAAVVREAVGRGHQVTSYSRRPPSEPVEGVEYVTGSLLDSDLLASTVADADVVFETMSPRGDMQGVSRRLLTNSFGLPTTLTCDSECSVACHRCSSPREVRDCLTSASSSPRSCRRSRPEWPYWRRSRMPLRRSTGSTSVRPRRSVPGSAASHWAIPHQRGCTHYRRGG